MMRLLLCTLMALAVAQPAAALDRDDWLSLVAMPLAVAAVSELTDVPTSDLINVVTALNQADVPPPQFIEVVRYVPVVLVDETVRPQFFTFLQTQVSQGVTRNALAEAIAAHLRSTAAVEEINVTAPRIVEVNQIIPPVVITRVQKIRTHPHGGPPGQLKKVRGVQTGAEIVHGSKPKGRNEVVVTTPVVVVDRSANVKGNDGKDKGGKGRGNSGKDNSDKGKGKGKGR